MDEDLCQTQKQLAEALNCTQSVISDRLKALGKVYKEGKWFPYELKLRDIERQKEGLRHHVRIHKDEQPYRCEFCGQMFRRKETLRRHMVAKHSNDKRFKSNKDLYTGGVSYKCGTCNKEFKDKAQLHIHERTHNGEKPYQCEFCEDKFRIKVHLTSHMVAKHADDERFKSNKDLYTGGVSYKCGTCKKEFKNKTDFNRHERTHTGEKPYQCKLCEDEFSCKVNLEQHVVGKHWNDERYKSNKDLYIEGITHKCRTCNKEFKKKVKLHNHEKIHKGEKPLNPKCEFCEDKFRQKEGLRHHVVAKHSNDECYKSNKGLYTEDESYKCGTYNIEFKNEAQLRSHERIHKDEQPYRCEFCGQMFRWVFK
ncbi:PREDICTED: zinc finger protein 808-like [Cyphomyrmex costatus]|uniref:zinc finger protein 808-like n=1 Tax=Cyphomyrmex costatus TaxID=456900 RepID=UPI0008523230|nr:PREDICTED: zinc finger protein 808-like [Cyphomyrmex costatus]